MADPFALAGYENGTSPVVPGSNPYAWMSGSQTQVQTQFQTQVQPQMQPYVQPMQMQPYMQPQMQQFMMITDDEPATRSAPAARPQPSWARRYWWAIALFVLLAIGGTVAAVIFLTKSSSQSNEKPSIVALDPGSRTALAQYRPGDQVFVGVTNPYPNTQWQFSLNGGLIYAVTTAITQDADGILYTIPTTAFTTDFRLRMVNADIPSQSVYVSFIVKPVPTLVSGPGNQTQPYGIGDSVDIQYNWTYPFSNNQTWRFDICEDAKFEAGVQLVSTLLARLNPVTKVLTWVIGDSSRIPATAVYYRLSTSGLSPMDVSVVSPEPIKINLADVPSTQFQFVRLEMVRNASSDTSFRPNDNVTIQAYYRNGPPPPSGIEYRLSYSTTETGGYSFTVPEVKTPNNGTADPLQFPYIIPTGTRSDRFVWKLTTSTNLSFLSLPYLVTNAFQISSMSITSSGSSFVGGTSVTASVAHENVLNDEYKQTSFEGSDNGGSSWTVLNSLANLSSSVVQDGRITMTYSVTLPSRPIESFLIQAKNGTSTSRASNAIRVTFSGTPTDTFEPTTLAFVANTQQSTIVEGSQQTLVLSFTGTWNSLTVPAGSRTCSYSIDDKKTWIALNNAIFNSAAGQNVNILITIPEVNSDFNMHFGFNNQRVSTQSATRVLNRAITKAEWKSVNSNLEFDGRVTPNSEIFVIITHVNVTDRTTVRCDRITKTSNSQVETTENIGLTLTDKSSAQFEAKINAPLAEGTYFYRVYLNGSTDFQETNVVPVFNPLRIQSDGLPERGGTLIGFADLEEQLYHNTVVAAVPEGPTRRAYYTVGSGNSRLDLAMSYIIRIDSSNNFAVFNEWALSIWLKAIVNGSNIEYNLKQCVRKVNNGAGAIVLFIPRQKEVFRTAEISGNPKLVARLSKNVSGTTITQDYDIRAFTSLIFLMPGQGIPGTSELYLPKLFRWQYAGRPDLILKGTVPTSYSGQGVRQSQVLRISEPPAPYYRNYMYADFFSDRNYRYVMFPLFYFAPDYDTFGSIGNSPDQPKTGMPGFIFFVAGMFRETGTFVSTNYVTGEGTGGDNPAGGHATIAQTKWWNNPIYPVSRQQLETGSFIYEGRSCAMPTNVTFSNIDYRLLLRRGTDITLPGTATTLNTFVIGIENNGRRVIGTGSVKEDSRNFIGGKTWFVQTYAWRSEGPLDLTDVDHDLVTMLSTGTYGAPKWSFVPVGASDPEPRWNQDAPSTLNNTVNSFSSTFGSLKHTDALSYFFFSDVIGGSNIWQLGDQWNPYTDQRMWKP